MRLVGLLQPDAADVQRVVQAVFGGLTGNASLESKAPEARVARQTTKHGLYNALDIGSIWLQKANENR